MYSAKCAGGHDSTGLAPEFLHAGDRLLAAHDCNLGAGQAQARDQQMREIGGQRLCRSFRFPPVRFRAALDALPEGFLIHFKLVAKDVAPDVRPVGRSVRWMEIRVLRILPSWS